jgi:hypothetical protein
LVIADGQTSYHSFVCSKGLMNVGHLIINLYILSNPCTGDEVKLIGEFKLNADRSIVTKESVGLVNL